MKLKFSDNFFKLFDLPQSMQLDFRLLDERYKKLQREIHPDQYASGTEAQKRWSMQATSLINQARDTLIDPLLRAIYLLSLQGVDLNSETDTQMSGEFLLAQIQLREDLEGVRFASDPFNKLDTLSFQVSRETKKLQAKFEVALLEERFGECRITAREWQFLKKIKKELQDIEISIENEQN